jgi:hypothetical protein
LYIILPKSRHGKVCHLAPIIHLTDEKACTSAGHALIIREIRPASFRRNQH